MRRSEYTDSAEINLVGLCDTARSFLCGAKKILLPQTFALDLGTVPAELMSRFSLLFYQSAEDTVFKALGVE